MAAAEMVVLGFSVAAIGLGWWIVGAVQLARPGLGVFSLADVVVIVAAVVLMPLVYVVTPAPLVSGLLLLAAASSLQTLCSTFIRSDWLVWSAVIGALAADIGCAVWLGPAFAIVNNSALVCVAGTVAALWVQSGLRARDTAVLTLAVALYDGMATGALPLTDNLLARLSGLPMAPIVSWGPVSVGLGDLLIATTVPMVFRKAFGSAAGLIAMSTALLGIGIALVLHISGPLMAVLGPILVLEYVACRLWYGPERTIWQYSHIGRSRGEYATVRSRWHSCFLAVSRRRCY